MVNSCPVCGGEVPQRTGVGRPRVYGVASPQPNGDGPTLLTPLMSCKPRIAWRPASSIATVAFPTAY